MKNIITAFATLLLIAGFGTAFAQQPTFSPEGKHPQKKLAKMKQLRAEKRVMQVKARPVGTQAPEKSGKAKDFKNFNLERRTMAPIVNPKS